MIPDHCVSPQNATSRPRTLDLPIGKIPLTPVDNIIRGVDVPHDDPGGTPTVSTPPTQDDSAQISPDDPGDTPTPATPPTQVMPLVAPVENPANSNWPRDHI